MSKIRARADNGKLFFDFYYRGQRCREQTTLDDTPANRKNMQQALARMEAEQVLGTFQYGKFFPNSANALKFDGAAFAASLVHATAGASQPVGANTPTVVDFSLTYRRENSVQWRQSTREWIDLLINRHLLPELGTRLMGSVRREELLDFRVKLSEKVSPTGRKLSNRTINMVMRVTRSMFQEAGRRYGFTNPAADIKRLRIKKTDIFPFTLDEVRRILQTVRPDYHSYFVCRFFTGMRSGELHGLKWQYVDFTKREILIRETFSKGRV